MKPRKSVQRASAYAPPLEGRGERIRLDFNENTAADTGYDRYPEYQQAIAAVADVYGLQPDSILLCNGSSEGIWMTSFAFIEPGEDSALTTTPTFSLIPQYLRMCGARLDEVPVDRNLEFDLDGLESRLYSGMKLVMIASPDNPTGAVLQQKRLEQWLAAYPGTLFFIDQAYAEYADDDLLQLTGRYENLLVSRTFSKAWGLAGLRLGFLAGSSKVIATLNKVRIPYNVNTAGLERLMAALPGRPAVEAAAQEVADRRQSLVERFDASGYNTHVGGGNFLLIKAGIDAPVLTRFLASKGVLIRDRSSIAGLEGMVRVTIGGEAEMDALFAALEQWRQQTAMVFDLDDTLVDTSKSYDEAVLRLVAECGGERPTRADLFKLREEGGFNDDWRAAGELLRRQGISVDYQKLRQRGSTIYLELAPASESMLIQPETLQRLALRYRLFVLTGRYRNEYEPVWANRLDPLFERVRCVDDRPELSPKPSPDQLQELLSSAGIASATYIGNSVDDMQTARASDTRAIGFCTTTFGRILTDAGAELVAEQPTDIREVFAV